MINMGNNTEIANVFLVHNNHAIITEVALFWLILRANLPMLRTMDKLHKLKERFDDLNPWTKNIVIWTVLFATIGVLFLVLVNAQSK